MPDPGATLCICNTSPLYYLHVIGKLSLLENLYGRIVTTPEVCEELRAGAEVGESVPNVQTTAWIEVRGMAMPAHLRIITDLGDGEASVIALGLEHPSNSLLIMDDKLGRKIARLRNLRVTGTAGVLLKAKQTGLLSRLRPVLEDMRVRGFRLHDRVFADLLFLAGEQ